jgi:2-polyprenyl-3-methyl-5-hydroxy-6-metoxy-1,4-benzoquinol methylase
MRNVTGIALIREPGSERSGLAPTYYLDERPDVQALVDPLGKRILDVGCAAGELGRALKRSGAAEVVGIEQNQEAASLAREKLDRVLIEDAQSSQLAIPESSFDYILFADVLEHTRDPWTMLATFRRYLKPDGRVVASIPNLRFYAVIVRLIFNRWRYADSGILDRTHLRFFTWPNIRQMFEQAGYQIERTEHKYRLFEDQSRIGRAGALASRLWCRFVAPLAPHFFAFQYLVVAKKA